MRFVALLLFLAFTACQSTPEPQTRTQYRLSTASAEATAVAASGIRVRVAAYLNQPGMIVEDADGGLHPAHYHQWSEPLDQALEQLIGAELSREASEQNSGNDVLVFVERLHGTMGGQALLSATYGLESEGKTDSATRFSSSTLLKQAGYSALVDAHRVLVRQLAAEISTFLSAAGKPEEPEATDS